MRKIEEAEQIILNYFTELFVSGKDCTETEAMLDARRWEAYDNGDYDQYVDVSIKLAEKIESHIKEEEI